MNLNLTREIEIREKADVLVAGGGLGGIAAALASARAGAETILIERNGFLGGVATAGMCCSVWQTMLKADGSFRGSGLPLEITDRLAVEAGPGLEWRNHKGHMIYDVEKAKLVFHSMLAEAGVRVLLETCVSDVITESGKVIGVICTDDTGLFAIQAKNVIDATGDSIVAELSGVPMKHKEVRLGGNWRHSYVFRLGNVDVDRLVSYYRDNPDEYIENVDINWTLAEALDHYNKTGTFLFPHCAGKFMKLFKDAEESGEFSSTMGIYEFLDATQMHMIRSEGVCHIITGFTTLGSLDSGTISNAILEGKKMAFYVAEFYKKNFPGFENCYISQTADDLGIRVSRWIDGVGLFERPMREMPYRCDDSIGTAICYTSQLVNKSYGTRVPVFDNEYYQIPLSCLIPKKAENLIMGAGRGASTNPPGLMREMHMTMICGQAAGVAAAVASLNDASVSSVDYALVRAELEKQEVKLG